MLIALNKPYGVISRFTPDGSLNRTLGDFNLPRKTYPLGRLDADTEGLLLLSDEPELNERILHPKHRHRRIYWAQVERVPTEDALLLLEGGLTIQDRKTKPCHAWILNPQPQLAPRFPPVRYRKSVPTCWIGLELFEGKNRQVRRMTAAMQHPTLRLIRVQIGGFLLGDLPSGTWRALETAERRQVLEAGETTLHRRVIRKVHNIRSA